MRGEWDRALLQLTVAGELGCPGALLMVQTYREALRCEVYRAQVFAGTRTPMALGEPDEWFAPLVQSLSLTAQGHGEEAQRMRQQAFEAAPASPGTLNGTAFEWIADGDARLGPCLELIISGRYYWVPFHRVRSLSIEAPADLRDFVWTPAQIIWSNGGEAVALIPTRYPGSEARRGSGAASCRGAPIGSSKRARLILGSVSGSSLRTAARRHSWTFAKSLSRARASRLRLRDAPEMAELTPQERLQPSLLDRLTDENPQSGVESRDQRMVSWQRLRDAVRRDLAWLLNCVHLEATQDLSAWPLVARSTVQL